MVEVNNNAYNGYVPDTQSKADRTVRGFGDEKVDPTVNDWDNSQQIDHVKSEYPVPSAPEAGGNGSGAVAVDTDAMRQVAKNMRSLVEPLQKSRTDVANIDVHAGGFPHGWSINEQIKQVVSQLSGGDGGKGFLGNAIDKLNQSADDLEARAAAHEKTEETNGQNSGTMADNLGDTAGDRVADAVIQAANA